MSKSKRDLNPINLTTKVDTGDVSADAWMYRDRPGSADVIVDVRRNGVQVAMVSVRVPYPRAKR